MFKSVDIGVHPCGVCHALEQVNMKQDASRVQRSSVAEIVSSKGSDSKKAQEAKEILELFPCSPGTIDPRRVEQTSPRPTLQKKTPQLLWPCNSSHTLEGDNPNSRISVIEQETALSMGVRAPWETALCHGGYTGKQPQHTNEARRSTYLHFSNREPKTLNAVSRAVQSTHTPTPYSS